MKQVLAAAAFALMLSPALSFAQSAPVSPQSAALSACIQRSTTAEDNTLLTRWIFIAMARHPTVSGFVNLPDAERVAINRQMGGLFNRLLLRDCRTEARAAWLADGQAALDAPFGTFGERAMTDLMANPDVNAGVAEMASYFDGPGFTALTAPE